MISPPTSTPPTNPVKLGESSCRFKIFLDTASRGAFGGPPPVFFWCTLWDTLSPFAFEQALRYFSFTCSMVRQTPPLAFTDSVEETCCPGNGSHPIIHFQMTIKRKSIYYDYIVIAPTIMLCILTLASFWLPCHHGEKIAIGLTVFLTLYVLQLLIAENVPDTNTTPVLGVFIFLVMTLNCISLIMATLVMSIKKRSTLKPVPPVPPLVLKACKQLLSKITCTPQESRFHAYNLCEEEDDKEKPFSATESWDSLDYLLHEFDDVADDEDVSSAHLLPCAVSDDISQNSILASALSYRRTLKNRRSYRRAIHCENQQSRSTPPPQSNASADPKVSVSPENLVRKQEWCYVAETVDKASFIVYLASMFVTILTVLVFVPSFQNFKS